MKSIAISFDVSKDSFSVVTSLVDFSVSLNFYLSCGRPLFANSDNCVLLDFFGLFKWIVIFQTSTGPS